MIVITDGTSPFGRLVVQPASGTGELIWPAGDGQLAPAALTDHAEAAAIVLTGHRPESRTQVNFFEAKPAGTALSRASLHGADLTGCDLSETILDGARYDQQTRWPDGFEPVAAGAKLE
jgi:hypothetical protein